MLRLPLEKGAPSQEAQRGGWPRKPWERTRANGAQRGHAVAILTECVAWAAPDPAFRASSLIERLLIGSLSGVRAQT